jgi:acyl phosphate:glycerol-3-phosphate acyltransferase
MPLLAIVVTSYLLGSIPFGYLLVRIFHGEDVRQSGSGNIGATNVSRKSPALGALTLLLDTGKGFAAVQLARSYSHFGQNHDRLDLVMAVAAVCAILGHMFPIWLKFRGGKGVATALGSFARFSPLATLIAVIIFLVIALVSRRISLGSIVAAMLFPGTVMLLHVSNDPAVLALIGIAALLVVFRHYENILRLLSGAEPSFSLRRR